MTRFAPRRFPDTITRKRTAPGGYERGQYVEGAVTETTLRASVQPLAIEDSDFVGGAQLVERLKVYVPQLDALLAAFDICLPDADPGRAAALDDLVERSLLSAAAADEFRIGGSREDETQVAFPADDVVYRLAEYVVEESRPWSGHTRAIVLRTT
ncbi:MAG: hypothetical protein OXO52_22695 [Rhodospirillales bacterium]|nr:hypothetical protein [Rhodospirillales bacterium]MDE0382016.1 hypothetical protein [Rhodospirillales bacterium]